MSQCSQTTTAVRAAIDSDKAHGAIVPPLCLSSNFSFQGYAKPRQYDYTRSGNPTRDALANALADLEGGAAAVVTCTGMAAVTLALQLVPEGGLLVAPHDCYGGTWRLFDTLAQRGRFRLKLIDQGDLAAVQAAFAEKVDLLWIETPSNPLLRVVDISALSALAHRHGTRVLVDNTFLSPVWQQPLALGADLVLHSTTKYINGHSDVVGGAIVSKDRVVHDELAWWNNCLGLAGAPFDSYLTLRGVRTLSARLRVHGENAQELAQALADHPIVDRVYFPGLTNDPGHELARRQQRGFGAMLSFELHGGEAQVRALLDGLRCYSLAESLGGVESLIAHPATMTHASMTPEARAVAGISDRLLRLSVGIEELADLKADLLAGLDRAEQVGAGQLRRAA
ncbi:MAG: cystathionine gamma-synthase [Rhodanobacteraceae bacterium]|nr:cystathionine gamma-synthase [Rhodanobacteraceae bacterium]